MKELTAVVATLWSLALEFEARLSYKNEFYVTGGC